MTKTSEIIRRARQLADLEGTDFISWNENIQLVNEAYAGIYQKLINTGDKTFLKSFHCSSGTVDLPSDFWQLKGVYQYNDGNLVVINRRAENSSLNFGSYDIIGKQLVIYGNYGDVLVEYYQKPQFLTYPNVRKEIELEEKDYIGCYGHKFYYTENGIESTKDVFEKDLDTGIETWVFNAEEIELLFANEKFLVLMTENGCAVVNVNTGFSLRIDNEIYVDLSYMIQPLIMVKGDELYMQKIKVNYDEETGIYSNEAYSSIYKITDGLELIETDKSVYIPPEGFMAVCSFLDDDFNNYNYLSVVTYIGEDVEGYSALFKNDKLITKLLPEPSDQAETYRFSAMLDNELYFVHNNRLLKVENDRVKTVTGVITYNANSFAFFNGFNRQTGYGVFNWDDSGDSTKYYMTSYCEDVDLNYPNSMMFNVMAYSLACAYKIKQNADVSGLMAQLQSMEETFLDTLGSDANQFPRMGNVY